MYAASAHSQRLFSRVPFSAPVLLQVGQQAFDVSLLDISLKGALIETAAPLQTSLEQSCRLTLTLSADGQQIEMAGRVAHCEGQHVGIRCEHIDLSSLTLLRRLLELNTGNSEQMDRELSQLFDQRP